MKTVLEQTFLGNDMGVCIKNLSGKVLQQNKLCSKICGERTGEICEVACMEIYAKDDSRQWNGWGSRVYNNSFVHDAYYDITLLCNQESLITFLQPLKDKHRTAIEYYENIDLTKRETQIIILIIQGVSNTDICKQLFVSKATLKTHLNKIYKKAKDKGKVLKYLPVKRLSARSF